MPKGEARLARGSARCSAYPTCWPTTHKPTAHRPLGPRPIAGQRAHRCAKLQVRLCVTGHATDRASHPTQMGLEHKRTSYVGRARTRAHGAWNSRGQDLSRGHFCWIFCLFPSFFPEIFFKKILKINSQ